MSRFCGLPIGLVTLPMVTAKASANNNILGEVLALLASNRTTGVAKKAEEEEHHIQVDGFQGVQRRYLQRRQNGDCTHSHDLPYLQVKLTDPTDDNQQKNKRENNYWNHLLQL